MKLDMSYIKSKLLHLKLNMLQMKPDLSYIRLDMQQVKYETSCFTFTLPRRILRQDDSSVRNLAAFCGVMISIGIAVILIDFFVFHA
jgi:hypothetical protein